MKPRKTAPTRCSSLDEPLAFKVWCCQPSYQEDPRPWKCLAQFYFLSDCLDFIAHHQDNGIPVVFQSPAHTNPVLPTDRRAVYRAPVHLPVAMPVNFGQLGIAKTAEVAS